ncbi:MAG: hemolysin III family protein [Coprothermobacterota bacterium]|nr:hemolysin III family protein [Coprothermobacterota bacterium]
MAFQRSELVNFYSHLLGAVASLAGYIILLCNSSGSIAKIVLSSIYSLCAVFLFTCSAIYHGQKAGEDEQNTWRRLDHIAIFFMIAGTYTPISYIYLDGWWRWGIIGAQWLLVILGLIFTLVYLQSPRWLTSVIYVLMGWMLLIPLNQLLATMPLYSILLLFGGGLAYTLGAVFYAIKKPNPFPGVFGFHEIFHLLVLIGAALHYLAIYSAIKTV